jgi:hypothetical protein
MIKHCIIIIGICFGLIGCSNERQVNILFDDAYSLTKKSDVITSGIKIGEIDKIRYQGPDSILITVKIDKAIFVSEDATFKAHSNFNTSEKYIEFIPGKQTERVSKSYIFSGIPPEQFPIDSNFIKIPGKIIHKLYNAIKDAPHQHDSVDILIEDVNKNLEQLNSELDMYEQQKNN